MRLVADVPPIFYRFGAGVEVGGHDQQALWREERLDLLQLRRGIGEVFEGFYADDGVIGRRERIVRGKERIVALRVETFPAEQLDEDGSGTAAEVEDAPRGGRVFLQQRDRFAERRDIVGAFKCVVMLQVALALGGLREMLRRGHENEIALRTMMERSRVGAARERRISAT